MVVGYLILLGLAVAFLSLGVKGFSSGGLPLSRQKSLTGASAKTVGAICLLLGLTVLGSGVLDLITMLRPPTETVVNKGENHVSNQVVPVVPVAAPIKPPGKPLQGLIAYWTFDGVDGTELSDASGRGNHAAMHGGKRVLGVKGSAVCLDGNGDWIDYGKSEEFNFAAFSPWTIAGWIKTDQQTGTVLSKRSSKSGWPALRLEIRTAFLGVYLHGDEVGVPGAGIQGSKIINDDKWHHFALVRFNEELMRLHIDGEVAGSDRGRWVQQAIKTDMRSLGSDRRWVEKSEAEFVQYPSFAGCLDEFCVFNRALDQEDVQRLARLDPDVLPQNDEKKTSPVKAGQ